MNLPDGYFLQGKKYQLIHTIGHGGFGITYKGVWNTVLKGGLGTMKTNVTVCIKEYFFKDYCYRDMSSYAVKVHSETGKKLFDKFKEKLIKEANILSAVHHPHIVNVLEVFEENNTAYIVMEYITGCSLKYMLDKKGPLAEKKALKYTHQIGNALDFVHDKNILHLDIKPSNILIDKGDNARLIDFGVSKRYDIEEQETNTATLTLSKGFASIEQYDDEGTQNFSPCPDVYSLGATLYNVLTGMVPVESILRTTKPMLAPSLYNANISDKTEKAILKAMEVKPENRFRTMKEMLADLDVPPYEFAENKLVETRKKSDEDNTELLGGGTSSAENQDDDENDNEDNTVVSAGNGKQEAVKPPKKKSRKKRRILFTASVLLFVFFGYGLVDYFRGIEPSQGFIAGLDMPGGSTILDADSMTQIDSNQNKTDSVSRIGTDDRKKPQDNNTAATQTQTNPDKTVGGQTNSAQTKPVDSQTKTTASPENNVAVPEVKSAPTPEETALIEKEYQALIASAKTKMNEARYKEALADLEEASKKKKTPDASALMQECTDRIEEANIVERRKKYDLLGLRLGNLEIARDKETGLFGAVDNKGIERIQCKYLTTDKSANGRAFQRSDNLYDEYDNSGKIIAEGLIRLE